MCTFVDCYLQKNQLIGPEIVALSFILLSCRFNISKNLQNSSLECGQIMYVCMYVCMYV